MTGIKIGVKCDDCSRVVEKETVEAAEELVESHNDSRHDGEDVAVVLGKQDPLPNYTDLLDDVHERSSLFHAHRNDGVFRAMCLECERIEIHGDVGEAAESARAHNEFAHEGEEVAGVVSEDYERDSDRRPKIDSPEAVELLAQMHDECEVVTPSTVTAE